MVSNTAIGLLAVCHSLVGARPRAPDPVRDDTRQGKQAGSVLEAFIGYFPCSTVRIITLHY